MNSEIYPWDTKERQQSTKPYGFVDFPENFLDVYRDRRQQARRFCSSALQDKKLKISQTLPDKIDSKESWKLLKKAELRKLKGKLEDFAYLALTLADYVGKKKEGYIQALSTCLKLNDLLISEKDNLGNLEKSLLFLSIEKEAQLVKTLERDVEARKLENVRFPELYKRDPSLIVENLGMLLQETNRSKAYIQKLINSGILPNFVLLLRNPEDAGKENLDINPDEINTAYFNPYISEQESLEQAGIPYQLIQAFSCNDQFVVDALRQRPETFFIFSGRGILKQALDAGKKLIHGHPGKLPQYRGSTCPYYSTLAGDGWHCTSFIMRPKIDLGEIINQKEFPLPRSDIDATRIYDPYTRSEVILDTAKQLAETGTLKTQQQDPSKGTTYYLIHPVLEYIAKESFKND